MKRLLKYMKGYTLQAILAPLFKMLEATFELLVPIVVAKMIDVGISGGDTDYLIKMSLVLAALGALGFGFSVTAQYFSARTAVGFAAILRHELFAKIHKLSFSDIDGIGTTTLVTRITADVNTVQNGVNLALRLFLRSPFIVFGAAVMAYTVDSRSTVIFASTILVLAVIVFAVMLVSMPLYKKVQAGLDRLTGVSRESLGGARVVRAFGQEAAAREKFNGANATLNRFQRIAGTISALTNPLTFIILNGAIIWLIYSGAVRVEVGALTVGAVVALYNYMSQILVELVKLANLIVTLTKGVASAGRVADILDMKDEETAGQTSCSPIAVSFDGVSLSYGGAAESLKGISFELEAGKALGIIGGTGSGKTTLTELIGRYYPATKGSVSVFGIDVDQWDADELRNLIAYVPQKAVLFCGTVRENLKWGNEASTDEELYDALRCAMAYDFVMAKEGGLDAPVTEGGKNFSGGQRQRLTIARALVKKAPILILDDSASALDMATEAALRANLRSLSHKPTVITVSQRTSSVMHCDQIIVLEEGEAVGMGTHAHLMENCGVYREIYASQFGEEKAK